MAQVISTGKKRIITNDGSVQLNLNDNRVLHYDGSNYRFVVGQKNTEENKVQMSNPGVNVLTVTT